MHTCMNINTKIPASRACFKENSSLHISSAKFINNFFTQIF